MFTDLLPSISIYGLIVGLYFAARVIFHWFNKPYSQNHHASSSVVIPIYQEDPKNFEACLVSCLRQNPSEVIIVDDGSEDHTCYQIAKTHSKKHSNLKVVRFERNAGKRYAQAYAFQNAEGEILVTVDSDTVLQDGSIRQITKPFRDPKIGAVTGQLSALNRSENILTRILNIRYIVAGALERAAYSFFKVVNCTSGPFSAYRRSLIVPHLNTYINQTHRGRKCTFGDDRYLASLILKSGHGIFFQKTARAETSVPKSLKEFTTQQLRWNRSFWRENWLLSHWMWKRSKYLTLGTIMDMALPFLYLGSLVWTLHRGVTSFGLFLTIPFVLSTSLMAFFRNLDALSFIATKDFIMCPVYAWIYLLILLPISVYALCTTNKTTWGTR